MLQFVDLKMILSQNHLLVTYFVSYIFTQLYITNKNCVVKNFNWMGYILGSIFKFRLVWKLFWLLIHLKQKL